MNADVLIFGLLVTLAGLVVLLMRKPLGVFASRYWSAVGSRREKQSEKYWVDYGFAIGALIIVVGLTITLVGAFGGVR